MNILFAGSLFLCSSGNALAALQISKTIDAISPSPAAEGASVRYNLSVTNTGPGNLTNVIIDDVPANLNNLQFTVTSANPPSNSPGPGTNQYSFSTLAAGETVTLNLDATVNAGNVCPTINNTATVSEDSATLSASATAASIEYDFGFTSGPFSNVISHDAAVSFCELCDTGVVRIRISNPGTAALENITLVENLQLLGLTYVGSTTTSPVGVASDPVISAAGTILTWTAGEIPALASLAAGATLDITFQVSTYGEASLLANQNRNIIASATFNTSCTGVQTVDSGNFELPLQEPVPRITKLGRNVDGGQNSGNYTPIVYGQEFDDIIWRVGVQNSGLAGLQDMLIADTIGGNFVVNYICPTQSAAETTAITNNGASPAAGCVAMTSPYAAGDLFGNPLIDVAASGNAFIYYVGRINANCSAGQFNTADIEWGCQASSPAGGISATSTGINPAASSAELSTDNGGGLTVVRDIRGIDGGTQIGSNGVVTITITNNSGGTVRDIVLDDLLPVEYVRDTTFAPVLNVAPLHATYDGMIDTIVDTNEDAGILLNNTRPVFTLTSSTARSEGASTNNNNMLRAGDVATITFRIVLVDKPHFDIVANLDVVQENPASTPANTDPDNVFNVSNTLTVNYLDTCSFVAATPLIFNDALSFQADIEDLDVTTSAPLYILTNDPAFPVPLTVVLTNNGGHDASNYYTYVSFGETIDVQTWPTGCNLTSNPPPRAVWLDPAPIPATAAVYECSDNNPGLGTINAGQTVNLSFNVIKNTSAAAIAADDLTFRADVIGVIELFDGSELIVPAPDTATINNTSNNYTLDAIRTRVLGFNLTKTLSGLCTEDANVPISGDANLIIGEDCTYHIEAGGWFGFKTPGFTLIEVRDVVVSDDLNGPLNGQGYIKHSFANDTGITNPVVINGGAVQTPLQDNDIAWAFNPLNDGITVKDLFFRVDVTTRLLNDPVDSSAAPNIHAADTFDIGKASFVAVFDSAIFNVDETVGVPGYPDESVRRVNLKVTEPNIIVVKEVCNETLYRFGPNPDDCSNFTTLANDGDTNDAYIYRIRLSNEANSGGVQRAPAYNVISTDTLDASGLMLVNDLASDGLDNDGDGLIDGADFNGEGTITGNTIGVPAVITFDESNSLPLLQIDPGATVTFYYRVDPDQTIAPLQKLTNAVSVSYDSLKNDFGNQNVPQIANGGTPASGRARIYTSIEQKADVIMIPLLAQPKTVIQLSNTTLAGAPHNVSVGEEVRYQLLAELPVANLRQFKIRDELPAGVRCIELQNINLSNGIYAAAGFDPGGPPVSTTCTSTGTNDVVEWNFGDQAVTASLPGNRFSFPVNFIARVENTAVTTEGALLTNGGVNIDDPLACTSVGGGGVGVCYVNDAGAGVALKFDAVSIVVREPLIALSKSFDVVNSDAGDVLTVTVTATNNGSAAAYNLRVLDDLVGSNMTYIPGSLSGTDPPDTVDLSLGSNKPIFSWARTNPDYEILTGAANAKSFTFKVSVDIAAQPLQVLTNTLQSKWDSLPGQDVALNNTGLIGANGSTLGLRNGAIPNTGNTLNDYETTTAASTSVLPLSMTKTDLDPAIIPAIGAHKHFQIKILLPEGTTNNLLVTDNLNAGNPSYVLSNNAAFNINYSFIGIASINNAALSEAAFNSFPADNTSGTATWNIGTVVTLSEDDIAASNITPAIIIDYYARADNILPEANVADSLQNSATVDYLSGATNLPAIQLQDDTLAVTVVEPVDLVATKLYLANITNPGVAPDIGDVLEYRVTVINNDVAEAFDVNIVDNLPAELLLDTSFPVTAVIDGVAASGFNPVPTGVPAGALIWGRGNADNSLDIPPAGGTLVLTYRAVVQVIPPASIVISNTVFVDWTSLDGDSIYERTGAGCPTITAPNDYCLGPIVAMVAIVEPDLILAKRVATPTVKFGTAIPYTLVLENIGTGTAYGATVVDKLPRVADNAPLTGGTCDVTPDNFVVRITDAADESIVLRSLVPGVDYTVSYSAQPTCELIIQTLSVQSGVITGEKLIIDYDAYLDSGSESGAALSNIAGVKKWFSQDISAGSNGALEFSRTITDGTSGVIDHQDTATVLAQAPTLTVQKTVTNVTTSQTPGNDAMPGEVLRYSITVAVPASSPLDATGVVVSDLVPANSSYIADSVLLNGLPLGQPDGGVSPLIAGVDISSSTPPLPTAGNGTILIGESATVTFDVLLDPVISSGTIILNQAIVKTPATGELLSDDPNIGGTEDPTQTLISSAPAFLVKKTSQDITADPAILLPGDTLRYTLTVENIGQENSINSLLSDQIPANTTYVANSTKLNAIVVADPAPGISPLAAGMQINAPQNTTPGFLQASVGDVASITFDVVVNASAVNGTIISNQGFFNGAGAGSGIFPQQASDDPGTALVDDPTINVVGNVPVVDAIKTVSILIDNGNIGVVDPGDTLRYTITTSNIGALPATNVVLTDAVPANTSYVANSVILNGLPVGQPDAGLSPLIAGIAMSSSNLTPPLPSAGNGVLSPANSATVTFDVIVNAGTAAGTIISNQGFIASSELPTEPTDADGNGANGNQPTVVVVGNVQQLAITKQVFVIGGGAAEAGKQLEYVVRVTNIGGIAASNVVITDDMALPVAAQKTYVAGSGLLDGLPAGVSFAGSLLSATVGNLAPAAVSELRFRVLLDAALNIGDSISNTADVSWDVPPNTISATAAIDIGGTPGSANLNGRVWHDADFSNDVGVGETPLIDYRVDLYRNNTQLATTVTDANGVFLFSGLPPNLPTGDAYELRYLAPGATATTASLGDTNSAFTDGAQRISNIFAASGTNVQNLNLPVQPNGVVYDSVLRVPVAGVRLIMINQTRSDQTVPASCFDDPIHASQVTQANGYYKFDLNFSDPLRCAQGDEYEIQVLPPAADFTGTTSVIIPPVEAVTGLALDVPNCPGSAADKIPATALHCENSDSDLPPPASIAPRTPGTDYYLKFKFNKVAFSGQIYNNHIPVDGILEAAVAISKVAGKLNVTRSDLVPYTITFNNTLGVPLFDVSIIDNFPAGFKYVTDSARVDGVAIEPQINGRVLTWPNLRVGINERRVIKLLLIVGSGVGEGEYVNTARAVDSFTSQSLSGVASATVRVIPDPTFDCSDVIGKVFEDRNLNTYQDEGERGIPGVQVATARGLRVTTDAHGRFHITCAIVANEVRGSNFILKLDERTLPSGYRVTTENPRVQRASRGKMLKFNFGTAIHRVVRLDLADGVFEKGKTTLRPQWRSRIDLLITELQKQGSILRLSYLAENESEDEVDDRLDAIEELLSDRWQELDCCYRLIIEKEVFWRKGSPKAGRKFE